MSGDAMAPPEPKELDATRYDGTASPLHERGRMRGRPSGDARCENCVYYLENTADVSYCWHPQLRFLVGADWWCHWWETGVSSRWQRSCCRRPSSTLPTTGTSGASHSSPTSCAARGHDVTARNRDVGEDDSTLRTLDTLDYDQLWLMAVDTGGGLSPHGRRRDHALPRARRRHPDGSRPPGPRLLPARASVRSAGSTTSTPEPRTRRAP